MTRNKWILWALPAAVIAVVWYNLAFFTQRAKKLQAYASTPPGAVSLETVASQQQPSFPALPAAPWLNRQAVQPSDLPKISPEELVNRAHDPVVPANLSLGNEEIWPKRDPFRSSRPVQAGTLARPAGNEPSARPAGKGSLEPEPTIKVSAILVHGSRRLAVVDGDLRQEGALVGSGKIVSIEPDSIWLQTSRGTRKVGLSPAEEQPAKPDDD